MSGKYQFTEQDRETHSKCSDKELVLLIDETTQWETELFHYLRNGVKIDLEAQYEYIINFMGVSVWLMTSPSLMRVHLLTLGATKRTYRYIGKSLALLSQGQSSVQSLKNRLFCNHSPLDISRSRWHIAWHYHVILTRTHIELRATQFSSSLANKKNL